MAVQTIEQQRAKFALEQIGKVNVGKEFQSAAENFPVLILTSGLGQAAAFYKSKKKNKKDNNDKEGDLGPHQELYKMLSDWLGPKGQRCYFQEDLLDGITQGDQYAYRAAQVEALALLGWVKKIAKACGEED